MKVFLEICKLGALEAGETICEFNTSSNRLFILVEGKLDVVGPDQTVLATLQGVQTVGEMGFITRKPRTATVRAGSACRVLRVDYLEFESLIERSMSLRSKIYRNMVRILADRLSNANDLVMRYRKLYESGRDPASFVAREETMPDLTEDAKAELAEVATAQIEGRAEADGKLVEQVTDSGKELQDEKKAAAVDRPQDSDDEIHAEALPLLQQFYELAGVDETAETIAADVPLYSQLRQDGYSTVDIEYAIKWTVRNIPAVKRFSLVKLSVVEAFEDKWSV